MKQSVIIKRLSKTMFFRRWSGFELLYYLVSLVILGVCTAVFRSDIVSLAVAIMGVTAGMLNMKANKLCFVFYLVQVVLYCYVSFKQQFFGEAVLSGLYLAPLYAVSVVRWLQRKEKLLVIEIYTLQKKTFFAIIGIGVGAVALYGTILLLLGSALPYTNALATFLCASAAWLASRRIKEQWYFWLAYSVVLLAMWLTTLTQGAAALPVFLQNVIFVGINLMGMSGWRKLSRYLNEESDALN